MKSESSFKKVFVKRHSLLVILCAFAITWSGCEKDYHYIEPEIVIPPPDTTQPPVSFSNDIQPIFTANCITSGCHDNNYDPDLRDGYSYNALFNMGDIDTLVPSNSTLYVRITLPSTDSDFMPQGGSPLPDADITKILRWIQEGAINN